MFNAYAFIPSPSQLIHLVFTLNGDEAGFVTKVKLAKRIVLLSLLQGTSENSHVEDSWEILYGNGRMLTSLFDDGCCWLPKARFYAPPSLSDIMLCLLAPLVGSW